MAGDYSVSGPHFVFYWHGNELAQGHLPHALRLNAEGEIWRRTAGTTCQEVDIVLCCAHFGSKKFTVFAFKVLFQQHGRMLIF